MTNTESAAEANRLAPTAREKRATQYRILVVEDDTTSEMLWREMVKKAAGQAKVDWATSEVEAETLISRAKAQGERYDLVITDIFLSGSRTGIDLWRKFFVEMRGRIIMTSGIAFSKFNQFFAGEVDRPVYLQKPLIPHECIEIIYQTLNRRIYA